MPPAFAASRRLAPARTAATTRSCVAAVSFEGRSSSTIGRRLSGTFETSFRRDSDPLRAFRGGDEYRDFRDPARPCKTLRSPAPRGGGSEIGLVLLVAGPALSASA